MKLETMKRLKGESDAEFTLRFIKRRIECCRGEEISFRAAIKRDVFGLLAYFGTLLAAVSMGSKYRPLLSPWWGILALPLMMPQIVTDIKKNWAWLVRKVKSRKGPAAITPNT